jgi:uncharacterized OB-fold protein
MVKQGVVPDDLNKPFFDAANEGRLVVQNCTACSRLHFPPRAACDKCGSGDNMAWQQVSGRGKIYNYGVVYDCPVAALKEDLPFNLAAIMLDEDPGILMYSHLPGVPADEVPVGGAVQVIFEETANGQKVPEWQVVQ